MVAVDELLACILIRLSMSRSMPASSGSFGSFGSSVSPSFETVDGLEGASTEPECEPKIFLSSAARCYSKVVLFADPGLLICPAPPIMDESGKKLISASDLIDMRLSELFLTGSMLLVFK